MTQHTLQSNVNCAVKSRAISKVTQSTNFNCTNIWNFQHTLHLTVHLLTVQLKLKVKLYMCEAPYVVLHIVPNTSPGLCLRKAQGSYNLECLSNCETWRRFCDKLESNILAYCWSYNYSEWLNYCQ